MLLVLSDQYVLIPDKNSFMATWCYLGKLKEEHYNATATVFRFIHGI